MLISAEDICINLEGSTPAAVEPNEAAEADLVPTDYASNFGLRSVPEEDDQISDEMRMTFGEQMQTPDWNFGPVNGSIASGSIDDLRQQMRNHETTIHRLEERLSHQQQQFTRVIQQMSQQMTQHMAQLNQRQNLAIQQMTQEVQNFRNQLTTELGAAYSATAGNYELQNLLPSAEPNLMEVDFSQFLNWNPDVTVAQMATPRLLSGRAEHVQHGNVEDQSRKLSQPKDSAYGSTASNSGETAE